MIETQNLTLDTVEYVLVLKVKYQIIRYIKHLTPKNRASSVYCDTIRRETQRMGMKKNFVTLNFQIVT